MSKYTVERYLVIKSKLCELMNRQSRSPDNNVLDLELAGHQLENEPYPIWKDAFIVQIDPNQDENELQYFDIDAKVPFLTMPQCATNFFLTVALLRSAGSPL